MCPYVLPETMAYPRSITGNWRIPSTLVTDRDEFMHVGDDGRIVHFVLADSSGSRVQPMMLWSDPLGENRYRVRGIVGHKGWVVGLIPTATGMTIEREEKSFYLKPATDSELPEWYPSRLEKALLQMSKREEEKEAEQFVDDNPS